MLHADTYFARIGLGNRATGYWLLVSGNRSIRRIIRLDKSLRKFNIQCGACGLYSGRAIFLQAQNLRSCSLHPAKFYNMKFIPTKIHGLLDYLFGGLLMATPWLLGFDDNTLITWIPVILGGSTLLYSLFTNYEPGLIKLLPMPVHLISDFLSGLVLASSPWLFGFADYIYLPHLALGLIEMLIVLLSKTVPSYETLKDHPVSAAKYHTQAPVVRKSPWITKSPRTHA